MGLDSVSCSVLESCTFDCDLMCWEGVLMRDMKIGTDKIESLMQITTKLETKLAATSKGKRKWASVRFVMKESQIKKMKDSLEETKHTLVLARIMELE